MTCLWSEHGGRIRDGHHDLVDQLHRNVPHDTDALGVLQGQCLRDFTLLSCEAGRKTVILEGCTKKRKVQQNRNINRPAIVSAPPLSMLPRDDMLLRPLGSDGEPETAAGLITAVGKPLHRNG